MSKPGFIGWRGIGPNAGKFVEAEDGFGYVCQQVGIAVFDETAPEADDFKEMLVDWFFSGDWLETYKEDV